MLQQMLQQNKTQQEWQERQQERQERLERQMARTLELTQQQMREQSQQQMREQRQYLQELLAAERVQPAVKTSNTAADTLPTPIATFRRARPNSRRLTFGLATQMESPTTPLTASTPRRRTRQAQGRQRQRRRKRPSQQRCSKHWR